MVSENKLTLDILPLSADTARLVRVYGTEPCIALPGTLPAPEGGSFAVTELGDYCFSEKPRSLPAADKTCRYEAAPDGTARLIRAFGQTVGGTCRRYDFDFDAPAAGSDADDLHPVCGNFLEELTLPDSLQVVGSCAFYNCRKLRLLADELAAKGLTVEVHEAGIWSEQGELGFSDSGGRQSTFIGAEKKTVPVTTIDAVAAGRQVTMIKMDVEGAEVQAIAGGRQTIGECKPKLFVAAYHYDVDLFRLPLLLWELVPEYKIYLRKHPYVPAWELNFICIGR